MNHIERFRLWDLPTRAFHWILVVLIALQWASGEFELLSMQWHAWLGYATLALLLFRLGWGFFGSDNVRFRSFLRGPRATLAYAKRMFARSPDHLPGHNPVGGLGVVALLLSLLVQSITGLFATDEVMVDGALVRLATSGVVDAMTEIHEANTNVLLVLIGLHLAGVLWHVLVKRENLVGAMFSGRAALPGDPGLRFRSTWLAIAWLAVASALVYGLVTWVPKAF